ncbi:SH2 domain-containing adapter protein B-like isoform X3 [Struthio camelus]|uniref:SH2 domain-containing adapter protein B-like isoform X3 n=1 Tax=Struthio camelus TaxID=8801 RepID=UPI003603E5D6
MAKWLNKYFSLGNNKTKSPPQPPRPDYREKRNGAGGAPRPDGPPHLHHRHHHTSPGFQHRHLCDDTSDLLRAYRAQKDLDFEDPYSGPGSSLRKLRAMCRPDYYAPEDAGEVAPRAFSTSSCCAAPPAAPAAGSPHLFRSHSERRPATPPDVKYISPKHRLIKVESSGSAAADSAGTMLSKGCEQLATPVPCATKEKVLIPDDYSDPFDAKSELNKMGKGENTGYMEPYEAQRIMTEIKSLRVLPRAVLLCEVACQMKFSLLPEFQRQENMNSHQKSMQLYETPYEPGGSGVESDSESMVSQRLRESKLPQDDDRPADEYDQPWEWSKVTIPALTGRIPKSQLENSLSCM